MNRRTGFAVAVLLLIAAPPVLAIEIDLAVGPGAWVAWGSERRGELGAAAAGDFNGDGIPDIAVGEHGWDGGVAGDDRGRVLLFFGPITFPREVDLQTAVPNVAILGEIVGGKVGFVDAIDLDGDGIDDLRIGAGSSGPDGTRTDAGATIIYLGRVGWPGTLAAWAEADWIFHGASPVDIMVGARSGDLNGDGEADLVLLAPNADGLAEARTASGEVYIFFGPARAWPKRVYDLAADQPDVVVYGRDGGDVNVGGVGDTLGNRLRIEDVVGDGLPDLILGAPNGAGPANDQRTTGEVSVIAGRRSWPPTIDLLVDAPDLLVYGPASSGLESSAVGDWDADGELDLILGGGGGTYGGRAAAGSLFVLRGRAALTGIIDLARTPAAERIVGPWTSASIGYELELGDVNGDGYSDLVATSIGEAPGRTIAGAVYVISGCEGYAPIRDLAIQRAELAIYGADAGDHWGIDLSLADFDGDGRIDILSVAPHSESIANTRLVGGEAHVILGRDFAPVCTVAAVAGPDASVCGVVDVPLDGSGTTVLGCSKTPQYRWSAGGGIVRDWSTDPTAVVRPSASTTYVLEVRCGDCAGPCHDTSAVTVLVVPDIVPDSVGNTLRCVRFAGDVRLTWASASNALSYSLHRSESKRSWPPAATVSGLSATSTALADVSAPPALYYYRSAGASCSGREGP